MNKNRENWETRKDESQVYEIDLSEPKKLMKKLQNGPGLKKGQKIHNMDCYPLLWCQQKNVQQIWNI